MFVSLNSASLLGFFLGTNLLELLDTGDRLVAHDATTPVTTNLVVAIVVVGTDGLNQLAQGSLILVVNVGEGNTGASLAVNETSKTCLALNDAVWNSHLSAQGWQEDDDLNGLDVMGNDNELSLFLLYHANNSVDSAGQQEGLLGGLVSSTFHSLNSAGLQTFALLQFALRSVLIGELEELGSSLSIKSLVELVDCWWHLQTTLKDNMLSLEPDVFWPLNKVSQVTLGLDILTNAEVLASLLKERVG